MTDEQKRKFVALQDAWFVRPKFLGADERPNWNEIHRRRRLREGQ